MRRRPERARNPRLRHLILAASLLSLVLHPPVAHAAGNAGNILAHFEKEGFAFRGIKMLRLTEAQARAFYEVHRSRPFYEALVAFMTSGPIVAAALERDDAVPYLRQVMGATNSLEAEAGTIRNLYGTDIEKNAVHGSDAPETAAVEIAYWFRGAELIDAG